MRNKKLLFYLKILLKNFKFIFNNYLNNIFLLKPNFLIIFMIIVIFINACESGPRYSSRIVETKTGAIRGVILELNSKHLEPVEVFKAVPYAQPPVGTLRFQPPKKLIPWKGTKLADTFAAVCPQNFPEIANRTLALMSMPKGRYQYLKKIVPLLVNQSEDCLTLNIYVPGSGNRGIDAPYSVFFLLHGESYEWGSGNPYDGSVLASYGHVIVITVNFRLGILGFIKTRASHIPGTSGGNLGIMDIIVALQWTRDNIQAFGGDPTRITLVGHDTGAVLANLVIISKLGKGLAHRTVLLSGSALSPWGLIPDPDEVRQVVSHQMACHLVDSNNNNNNNNSKNKKININDDVTDCLLGKPLEALLGVRLPSIRFMPLWGPFLPLEDSADPEFAMEHAGEGFITSELMIGVTTTESYNDFSASDIQYGLEEEQRNRLLRTYIRNAFSFHLNEIFSAVRNEYTDWDKPVQHPINIRDSTMEALSDGHTVAPLIKVGYLHARRGAKTYLFHFGYQTKDSEYPQRLGSVRGEDIPYIFGLPLVLGMPNFPQNYSRQDMGVAEAVLNFITNFCKTGDPNEAGHTQAMLHPDYGTAKERTRYRGITWEPYETTTQLYLSISLKPKMKSHYRGHKMALWLNLIPQLHRPGDPEVSMRHHHFRERDQHYYAGAVRPESFTRPKLHYSDNIVNDVQESRQLENYNAECTPDPSFSDTLQDTEETTSLDDDDDDDGEATEEELLAKLANKHYYSYTAALGVTVGVGCLLLVLNMLIFAGIYYQRDRSKRKTRKRYCANGSESNSPVGLGGSVEMTTRSETSITISPSLKQKVKQNQTQLEPPPSYTTTLKNPCIHKDNHHHHHNTLPKGSSIADTYKQQNTHHSHNHQKCTNQSHSHQHQTSTLPHPKTTNTILKSSNNNNTNHNSCSSNQQQQHIESGISTPPQPPQRTSSNLTSTTTTATDHHQSASTTVGGGSTISTSAGNNSMLNNSNSTTNSNTSTLKKRVQIQEVTV